MDKDGFELDRIAFEKQKSYRLVADEFEKFTNEMAKKYSLDITYISQMYDTYFSMKLKMR